MNCHIRHYRFVASILLFALPGARAQDQLTLRNLFEQARERSDIKAKGMPGFVLRGDVRIWVKKDAASNGKYLFVWTPEGRWKEEVVFPGYKRIRIGDGTQFWQVRSPENENPAVTELDQLLKESRAPKTHEDIDQAKWFLRVFADRKKLNILTIRELYLSGYSGIELHSPGKEPLPTVITEKGKQALETRWGRMQKFSCFAPSAGREASHASGCPAAGNVAPVRAARLMNGC